MIVAPNVTNMVGVFTMGFGIMASVVTNNVSALGALGNALLPLRKVERPGRGGGRSVSVEDRTEPEMVAAARQVASAGVAGHRERAGRLFPKHDAEIAVHRRQNL